MWSTEEAKAKLSLALRRAREGERQMRCAWRGSSPVFHVTRFVANEECCQCPSRLPSASRDGGTPAQGGVAAHSDLAARDAATGV